MDNDSYDIDDEYHDLTDSDNTSSSSSNNGYFSKQKHLVLELHDLKKDTPEQRPLSGGKIRKHKKKRRKQDNQSKSTASSSSNVSERTDTNKLPVPPEQMKEEFYDARGSFHGLQETLPTNENRDKRTSSNANATLKIKSVPTGVTKPSSNKPAPTEVQKASDVPLVGPAQMENLQLIADITVENVPSQVPALQNVPEKRSTNASMPEVITSPVEMRLGTVLNEELANVGSDLAKEVKGAEVEPVATAQSAILDRTDVSSRQPSTLTKPVQKTS